jgi:hypothetical protein
VPRALERLGAGPRLAALGGIAILISMLLPWYGFRLGARLSTTALDSFNFAHAALVLTVAGVLWVVLRSPSVIWPRPLSEGVIIVLGGAWAVVLIGYLMADPPDLLIGTAPIGGVKLRYGIFVALGGAAAMILGGVRTRAAERHAAENEAGRPEGRPTSASEVPRGSGLDR